MYFPLSLQHDLYTIHMWHLCYQKSIGMSDDTLSLPLKAFEQLGLFVSGAALLQYHGVPLLPFESLYNVNMH